MVVSYYAPEPDRQVAHITQGDYEEMAFSPSGRYLVLADRVEHRDTVVNQLVLYDFDRQRLDTILTARVAQRYVHYAAIVYRLAWNGDSILVASYYDGDVGETAVTLRVQDRQVVSEEYEDVGIDLPPDEVVEAVTRLYPEARQAGPDSSTVFGYALSGPTIRGPDFIVFQYRVHPQGHGVWLYGLTQRRIEQLQALPDGGARYGFVGGFVDGGDVLFLSGNDTLTLNRWRAGQLVPVLTLNSFWQNTRLYVRGSDGERTWFVVQQRQVELNRRDRVLVYQNGVVTDVAPELETADLQMHFGRRLMALSFWQGTRRQVVVRQF